MRYKKLQVFWCCVGIGWSGQLFGRHVPYPEAIQVSPVSSVDRIKLMDSESHEFSLDQYRGRLILVDFFFTSCPNICPPQTAGLVKTWDKLDARAKESLVFVSISIDPEHDNASKILEYRQRFGIQASSWIFARGDRDQIRTLAKQLGALNDDKGPLEHRGRLYLIDKTGRFLRSFASALTLDSTRLAADLNRAVQSLF